MTDDSTLAKESVTVRRQTRFNGMKLPAMYVKLAYNK